MSALSIATEGLSPFSPLALATFGFFGGEIESSAEPSLGGTSGTIEYPASRGIKYIIRGKRLKKIYDDILESKNLKVIESAKWLFGSVNWEIVASDQGMIDRLMALYDQRNMDDVVIDPVIVAEPKKKGRLPMAVLMMMME